MYTIYITNFVRIENLVYRVCDEWKETLADDIILINQSKEKTRQFQMI